MLLPQFGVKNPVTNLMIFLGIIVMGVVAILFLPIDLMPEMEIPAITVITTYRGASAEDVETAITKHIENDLSIVSNVTELISYSREGVSNVVLRFNWGTNLDEAANEIRDRLGFTEMRLPDDAEKPIIIKFSTTAIPVLGYGVTTRENLGKLYETLDKGFSTPLKQIEGVGAVQLIGGLQRQINVEIDKGKLAAYGISINEVESAIRLHNFSQPAGSLKVGPNEYMLQTPGEYEEVSEIGETIVRVSGGANSAVRLKDIAVINDDFKDPSGMVYVNGEPGMMVMIQKQSGANSNEVCGKVHAKLESIKKALPSDVKIIEMFNTGDMINLTIKNLRDTIFWGGILVIIVTLLFLGELRSSLIIALTIPFSLVSSFVFLYIWGRTVNMISLASISIAIGMVVDNAIVVMENIFTHRAKGAEPFKAAITGASEVGLAVSASALTTIVVFVPLIFLKGITGIMFKELGVMVIVTIVASLMTALTFTPMLASRFLSPKSSFEKHGWFQYIEELYGSVLDWALANRVKTVIIAILILFGSIALIPIMGTEFFPEEDTGDIRVTVELAPGKRMEESLKVGLDLEKICREACGKDMKDFYIRTGSVGLGGAMMGMKEGTNVVMVGLKLVKVVERERSDKKIAEIIRQRVSVLPGIVKMDVKTGDPMAQMMSSSGKPISVEVYGNDMDQADKIAFHVRDIMRNTPGAKDPAISREIAKPEWKIVVDADKAANLGLTKNFVAQTSRAYFYGRIVSKYREKGEEYDIFIRLRPEDRRFAEDVLDASIASPSTGQNVLLSNIAIIQENLGPIEIERKNQTRVVRVEANLHERPLGDVGRDIKNEIFKLPLPEGVTLKTAGLITEQEKSFRDLILLLLLSVFLVYAVMASQFESLFHPFIIIFSVPFGFSGVFLSLFLRGYPISMVSLLGLVLLVGVVVNNAIVLVDY
ncbi:MAG: efflux RND transporter permease subunit, partial [Planctomycetota bacterium]